MYLCICLVHILSACFLCICISCVSYLSMNGTDFPATFLPTQDCLFLPLETGPVMLHLCALPCGTVGAPCSLPSPTFWVSFPISLFPIMAILDKLALLLIPVGETVSPTAAVMRSQLFQKWGKHGLYHITPTPSLHWEHLSCGGHLTNP